MIFDKYLYSKDKILNALYKENQSFLLKALQNDKIDKNLKVLIKAKKYLSTHSSSKI